MVREEIKLKKYYYTSDLALAATISITYPIDSIDKQNPRKANFIFKRHKDFDKLVESYWKRSLTVEPQTYFNQLRAIKQWLYSEI